MTQAGTCHPSVKAIFDSLSACGVDVVALKRSIAFGLLRSRARAYCAIYDAVKTPRSDVDYSLSPPSRSSVRTALCPYSGHSPLVPLPLQQSLWLGQWTPVNGPSSAVKCLAIVYKYRSTMY